MLASARALHLPFSNVQVFQIHRGSGSGKLGYGIQKVREDKDMSVELLEYEYLEVGSSQNRV